MFALVAKICTVENRTSDLIRRCLNIMIIIIIASISAAEIYRRIWKKTLKMLLMMAFPDVCECRLLCACLCFFSVKSKNRVKRKEGRDYISVRKRIDRLVWNVLALSDEKQETEQNCD